MGIVLEPLSKTSVLLSSGWVVVLAEDQPPSKTSKYTCFRQWLGGGAGKEPTAVKNKCNCFQGQLVVVLAKDQPPLKTSIIAHFGSGWVVVVARDQLPSKMLVFDCVVVVVVSLCSLFTLKIYLKRGVS